MIEGSYTDYRCLFGDHRTAYSDLCAQTATAGDGTLLILLDENGPCGYLCHTDEGQTDRIAYIFVVPHRRRQGIARTLLTHQLAQMTKEVWINLSETAAFYPQVHALITSVGFFPANASTVYRSGEERGLEHWQSFMEEKGYAMNRLIERMGFTAYSFREAPAQFLDALYHSAENDYGNLLDVQIFFDGAGRALDMDMSFLLVHRGTDGEKLAAYSLVVRPDAHTAVFEHMSVTEEFQHTGCVFLAISHSMDVFQREGCNRAAYTIYDDNKRANAFCRKIFDRVTARSYRTCHYMLRRKNIDPIGTESI